MKRYGRCVKILGRLVPCVQVGPVLIPLLAIAKKNPPAREDRKKWSLGSVPRKEEEKCK